MLFSVFFAGVSTASELPFRVQAELFRKIFEYDRTLSRNNWSLLIVYTEKGNAGVSDLVSAFRSAGISASAAPSATALGKTTGTSVVYFFPEAGTDSLRAVCASLGILTISGTSSLARNGGVSVAVGLRPDSRPEIVVNLPRVKAERHDLASGLLSLAEIVR